MDTQQQILIEQKVANAKKSVGIAYLLWFFLGAVGAHRLYLGRTGSGAAIAVLILGGLLLSLLVIGIPMLIIGSIWLIVDLFLIPGIVDQHEQATRKEAMLEVGASTQASNSSVPTMQPAS